uniref:Uncharacterized protein n=1 Tax=Rhizophora mucronata TaxID=61149 RepID=A0A2P2JAJ1_RHIMU
MICDRHSSCKYRIPRAILRAISNLSAKFGLFSRVNSTSAREPLLIYSNTKSLFGPSMQ